MKRRGHEQVGAPERVQPSTLNADGVERSQALEPSGLVPCCFLHSCGCHLHLPRTETTQCGTLKMAFQEIPKSWEFSTSPF